MTIHGFDWKLEFELDAPRYVRISDDRMTYVAAINGESLEDACNDFAQGYDGKASCTATLVVDGEDTETASIEIDEDTFEVKLHPVRRAEPVAALTEQDKAWATLLATTTPAERRANIDAALADLVAWADEDDERLYGKVL